MYKNLLLYCTQLCIMLTETLQLKDIRHTRDVLIKCFSINKKLNKFIRIKLA